MGFLIFLLKNSDTKKITTINRTPQYIVPKTIYFDIALFIFMVDEVVIIYPIFSDFKVTGVLLLKNGSTWNGFIIEGSCGKVLLLCPKTVSSLPKTATETMSSSLIISSKYVFNSASFFSKIGFTLNPANRLPVRFIFSLSESIMLLRTDKVNKINPKVCPIKSIINKVIVNFVAKVISFFIISSKKSLLL